MEKFEKAHGAQVACLFFYTKEAHPDDGPEDRKDAGSTGGWRMKNNKIQIDKHTKYADRLDAAKDLRKAGKEKWRVLVDDMKDTNHAAWGNLPNMAFLVDPQGRIHHKWSWVASSTGKSKRSGDDGTSDLYTLLKAAGELAPYTVADDPQLPLRDTVAGEWLRYGDTTVKFAPAGEGKVKRDDSVIELAPFKAPAKPTKATRKDFKLGKHELPCVVTQTEEGEIWVCTRLPGDGVVKVVKDGTTLRELTDAGFTEGKSCLAEYKPE